MAFMVAGTVVGLSEKPYEFEGRVGVARKLSVSDGSDVEEISISQARVDELGSSGMAMLRQLGRPVVCRVTFRVQERDGSAAQARVTLTGIDFVRTSDLAQFGYRADVYVEDDEGGDGMDATVTALGDAS